MNGEQAPSGGDEEAASAPSTAAGSPPSTTVPPSEGEGPPPIHEGPGRRTLVVGLVAAGILVIGAIVLVLVLATSGPPDPLSAGSGSATITWTSGSGSVYTYPPANTYPPPQPFGGTIDGVPVSGVATMDISAIRGSLFAPSSPPASIHIFEYTGTFDGEHFRLGLSFLLPGAVSPHQRLGTQLARVQGTFGHRPVNVELVAPVSAPASVSFHGTIGDVKVSGTFSRPSRKGANNTATASFTVTK